MNEHENRYLSHEAATAASRSSLRNAAIVAVGATALILSAYYQTAWSMVSIWERSDTFAHCFLIAPISAWLIWSQRKQLINIEHRPNLWALAALVIIGFGWLLADLAHALVGQQYCLVAMIPFAVWGILGNRMAWAVAFPLAYLLLAVPFGEVLIPALVSFTADFTVTALQLTGIPVYREGNFFTLPSGSWSVVEACSGLRYLIASFTLGTLFAYLTYHTLKRRLAFIALSLVVPIIANGLRAYMIVMIGHFSGMRHAVGADHLIYGWAFFGLVMLLLFWVGSFWREEKSDKDNAKSTINPAKANSTSLKATAGAAVAIVAVAVVWPAYAGFLDRDAADAGTAVIDIPGIPGKWEASSAKYSDWQPGYVGSPVRFLRTYQNGASSVSVHIAAYRHQRPGSQLITSGNVLVSDVARNWHNVAEQTRSISPGSQPLTIRQNQLHSPSQKLLIWRWYRLAEEETTNPYLAKMILARHKLLARGDDGAEIIVATRYDERPEEAVPVLQSFIDDMMPAIRTGLSNAARR